MSQQRIELLERIGFQWAIREAKNEDAWESRYSQLQAFKASHGDCNVPTQWPENPQLGRWVSQQRQARKAETLQPERQRRLDALGFDWRSDSHKEEWATRFEQLKAYKQRFGHCRIPVKWPEDPQLGVWVTNLRHRQKRGKLSPEKESMLAEIGFE